MLVFCAVSVYHPTFKNRLPKGGGHVRAYAFPTMAAGTITLVIGMLICSYVVEMSTREMVYELGPAAPKDKTKIPKVCILWLQKSHTVSDQVFDSFVLFAQYKNGPRDYVITSHRDDQPWNTPAENRDESRRNSSSAVSPGAAPEPDPPSNLQTWAAEIASSYTKIASSRTESLTILGVFFGICGFILQFEGLRGMNWSASIAQLVCILLMTIWRAWVRRGLIAMPIPQKVLSDHEMDWLALRIAKHSEGPGFWLEEEQNSQKDRDERMDWAISTGFDNFVDSGIWEEQEPNQGQGQEGRSSTPITSAQLALNVRQRLGQLTNWAGQASLLSIAVADSIEILMNHPGLFPGKLQSLTWFLAVKTDGGTDDKIQFTAKRNPDKWHIDATYIEAALSLWLLHIRETETAKDGNTPKGDWLRKAKSSKRKIIRLLGLDGSLLRRDIGWWIGDIDEEAAPPNSDGSDGQSQVSTSPVGFLGVMSDKGSGTKGKPAHTM